MCGHGRLRARALVFPDTLTLEAGGARSVRVVPDASAHQAIQYAAIGTTCRQTEKSINDAVYAHVRAPAHSILFLSTQKYNLNVL